MTPPAAGARDWQPRWQQLVQGVVRLQARVFRRRSVADTKNNWASLATSNSKPGIVGLWLYFPDQPLNETDFIFVADCVVELLDGKEARFDFVLK